MFYNKKELIELNKKICYSFFERNDKMDKDNCLVKMQGEDGKTFDMLILKEFDYKNKKYAVLSEFDSCHCHCNEECDCEENECTCDDDCNCGCKEGKECTCGCNCHCDDDCHCDENSEPFLCLLEITQDEEGNEVFKSIDDEKLFDELIKEADKVLYED